MLCVSVYRRQLPHHLPRIHGRRQIALHPEGDIQHRTRGSRDHSAYGAFLDLTVRQDEFDVVRLRISDLGLS